MSLILRLADMRNPSSLASKIRRKRFEFFESLLAEVPRPVRILDVGGTEAFWRNAGLLGNRDVNVTLLNVAFPDEDTSLVEHVRGDARTLNFPDRSFDVVFSNSVIEHVGGIDDQRRMAEEIRRVGQRHFVQTPNYFFPIEPHFLFPGFQFMPIALRARMLTSFGLGWNSRQADLSEARSIVESITLLKLHEVRSLFPDSSIYHERFCGMTKSFVAYGGFSPS